MIFSEISRRFHGLDAFLKVLLCVVLVVSLCPPLAGAFAEEPDADGADAFAAQVQAADAEGEGEAPDAALAGEDGQDVLPTAEASDDAAVAVEDAPDARADGAGDSGKVAGNAAGKADAVVTDDAKAASEGGMSSSTQLDGAILLKAKAKGIRATLLVDASAELPAGAKLVVTPLVKHEAAREGDAAETKSQDGEASDELEGSEAADAEGATLEAQQEEAENAVAAADDEATAEDESVTSEGDEATADEPTTITGAQAALSGMTKAVQAYRAKKKAGDATVVDAYAIEVVDAQGHVVPVDDDAAKLTVTLEDGDEDAADYDKVYAVERDAEEQQSVSDAAETEYPDEAAAGQAVPYQAEATDVTETAKTDEQAEETTIELEGVRSIATTTEIVDAADASTSKKPKASGPRKVATPIDKIPTTHDSLKSKTGSEWLMEKGQTYTDPSGNTIRIYDTKNNGISLNLFDYDAGDRAPIGGVHHADDNEYGNVYFVTTTENGVKRISDINYAGSNPVGDANDNNHSSNASRTHQLQFYSHGNIGGEEAGDTKGNDINQFAGYSVQKEKDDPDGKSHPWDWDYKQQYANQGIVKDWLYDPDGINLSRDGYPVINKNNGESLSYLFDTNAHQGGGKTVYSDTNGLFYENLSTNRLEYDSNSHYAFYCKDDNEFALYNKTYKRASSTGQMVGFFPFDPFTNNNDTKINPTSGDEIDVKHHFGMTLSASFTMPFNGEINGVPMVFDFSGDDDMWVFIDGQLVLDIGGIHQPVSGTIDFSGKTGSVTIGSGTDKGNKDFNVQYTKARDDKNRNFYRVSNNTNATEQSVRTDDATLWGAKGIFGANKWRAGTTHEIKVFYLERGGCDSNLKISTNIHLMTKKQASVKKVWDSNASDGDKTPVHVQLIRKAVDYTTGDLVGYSVVEEKTLQANATDEAKNWKATWSNLDTEGFNPTGIYYDGVPDYVAGSENGDSEPTFSNRYCKYTYLVREVPLPGNIATYSTSSGNPIATEKVGEMDKVGVEITKNEESGSAASAKVIREKRERDGSAEYVADSSYDSGDKTINAATYWKYGIGDLPAYAIEGEGDSAKTYDYAYKLQNSDGLGFFARPYHMGNADGSKDSAAIPADFSTVTITNKSVTLDVEKVWEKPDGTPDDVNHMDDTVWVQLYKQVKKDGNWEDPVPEGNPVELKADTEHPENSWKHRFKVNVDDNVRYFVKEGKQENSEFKELRLLTGVSGDKTYAHDYTAYTRDGAETNDSTEAVDFERIADTVETREYKWDSSQDGKQITRTFDGQTEFKQTGGVAAKYPTDTVQVKLVIPSAAASMGGRTQSDNDYAAVIQLPSNLAPRKTGAEGQERWAVSPQGFEGISCETDESAGRITVTVPAATARDNAGKTIMVTVPLQAVPGDDDLADNEATSITVSQSAYRRAMAAGDTVALVKEPSGGQYVSIPEGYTHADATIANKHVVTKLSVRKVWTGDVPSQGVWVRLKKDGKAIEPPVQLSSSGDPAWTHVFDDLELGGTYTAEEGTYDTGSKVFSAYTQPFELTTVEGAKIYTQKSIEYLNADGSKRQVVTLEDSADQDSEKTVTAINNLDGMVAPDAGKVVITNGLLGSDIKLLKVDADDEDIVIEGAKFRLLKDDGAKPVSFDKAEDTECVPDASTEFETRADGTVDLPSLQPGDYWLLETVAPAGYIVRDSNHPVHINVNESGIASVVLDSSYDIGSVVPKMGDPDNGVYTLTVPNLRVYELPSTAGPGILELVFLGAFVMTLAVGLWRRREPEPARTRR